MHSIEVVKHCLSFGGLWTRHLTSLLTPGVGPAPPFYLHNSSANQLQLSSDLFCCILPSKRYSGTSYLGPLEAWPWVLGGCTYLVGS